MKVLLTGATGFVGKGLSQALLADGHAVTALVRSQSTQLSESIRQVVVGDLADATASPSRHDENAQPRSYPDTITAASTSHSHTELEKVLTQTDVVIHMAARVHVMNDKSANPLEEFRRINTVATLALARQAADAGVKRFIFLSTVKVHGESTDGRGPFSESDVCNPIDPYAISKWEAEQALMDLSRTTGMELVIIRPPLIYGPGVKGNFARMLHWVNKGIPLPLGKAKNQRSLLALDNLVSFIGHCLDKPEAANQVYLLSDGEDVSTAELIRKIADAQHKKARLWPVPLCFMQVTAGLLGKQAVVQRILGSLQIDSLKARHQLGWQPVVTITKQLKKCVD